MAPESRGGGGGLSRRAAIALITGGGLLGISGTGAFGQVDGDRAFSVSTADNANALLKIDGLKDGEAYEEPHEVTITNRFNDEFDDNTISVSSGNLKVKSSQSSSPKNEINPSPLAPKEDDSFFIVATSEQSGQKQGEISVVYSGSDKEVELKRDISIDAETDGSDDCSGPRRKVESKEERVDNSRTVELREKVEVTEYVNSDGCIILFEEAVIKGPADAGGKVRLGQKSDIKSNVIADGNIVLKEDAQIENTDKNDLAADGAKIELGEDTDIKGDVKATDDVILKEGSRVHNSIIAGGSVTVKEDAEVTGSVEAEGDIVVSGLIKEDAATGEEFSITGSGEVKGKEELLSGL